MTDIAVKVKPLDLKIARIEKDLIDQQVFLDEVIAQKQKLLEDTTKKVNFLKAVKVEK